MRRPLWRRRAQEIFGVITFATNSPRTAHIFLPTILFDAALVRAGGEAHKVLERISGDARCGRHPYQVGIVTFDATRDNADRPLVSLMETALMTGCQRDASSLRDAASAVMQMTTGNAR